MLVGLLLALSSLCARAETVRLCTWDLESVDSVSNTLSQAAATLSTLHPDVILLQGVRDWQECAELVQALKPSPFNIALCSAFPAGTPSRQVAILSRFKAYFSWSQPWLTPAPSAGGFGFVALEIATHRVGFLTAECGTHAEAERAPRQLLEQVDAVRNWQANQVATFVLAGAWNTPDPEPFEKAGFLNAQQLLDFIPATITPSARAEASLLLQPSTFPFALEMRAVAGCKNPLLVCDLELDPTRAGAAWKTWADQQQTRTLASLARQRDSQTTSGGPAQLHAGAVAQSNFPFAFSSWLAATIGGALTLLPFTWFLARRKSHPPAGSPALLTDRADTTRSLAASYTLVVGPAPPAVAPPPPDAATQPPPALQLDPPGATQTQSGWQQRALDAEARADKAQTVLRRELLPSFRQWLREKFVRKLASDRAKLLDAQQAATHKATLADQRLARIESQIRQQNRAYEQRIADLTCELLSAKDENRELIRARIAQVKAEMAEAQTRLRNQAVQ
ncbi:MAG TPA: endonuclease/exonuclease/phosphatase family protein [Verrucomicrobiae bacterium]|nr:endonuclease/exonuclease/phosphatase family protein [Verrucomicrobiae bacterium]